jgi:hypothetical protein
MVCPSDSTDEPTPIAEAWPAAVGKIFGYLIASLLLGALAIASGGVLIAACVWVRSLLTR